MLQLTVYTFVVLLGCSFASIAAAETRNFVWIISETTDAPDGVSRSVLAVNGQPGYKTVLDVNVGDTVRINVTNMLTDTPTAIHFHGILQQNVIKSKG